MKQEAGILPALILLIFSLFEYIPEIHHRYTYTYI